MAPGPGGRTNAGLIVGAVVLLVAAFVLLFVTTSGTVELYVGARSSQERR